MSLSSLPLAKDVLGINPSDEDWLQFCLTCVSPFGDVVIVASGKSALIYLKKFDADSKVFYKLSKTYAAEEDIGEISAISYIPVRILRIFLSYFPVLTVFKDFCQRYFVVFQAFSQTFALVLGIFSLQDTFFIIHHFLLFSCQD